MRRLVRTPARQQGQADHRDTIQPQRPVRPPDRDQHTLLLRHRPVRDARTRPRPPKTRRKTNTHRKPVHRGTRVKQHLL